MSHLLRFALLHCRAFLLPLVVPLRRRFPAAPRLTFWRLARTLCSGTLFQVLWRLLVVNDGNGFVWDFAILRAVWDP